MKCPKCNNDLGMTGRNCDACGWGDGGGLKPRRCGLAVAAFVFSLIGIFTLLLGWLIAVPLAIKSLLKIKDSGGLLKGKRLAVTAILLPPVIYGIFFLVWSRDMPPLEKEFTIADLRSAPVKYNDSYAAYCDLNEVVEDIVVVTKDEVEKDSYFSFDSIVKRFGTKSGDPGMGPSEFGPPLGGEVQYGGDSNDVGSNPYVFGSPDEGIKKDADDSEQVEVELEVPVGLGMDGLDCVYFKMLKASEFEATEKREYVIQYDLVKKHRKVIERLWKNTEKSRRLLKELDGYPEIADLAESTLSRDRKFYNLRPLGQLTRYFCLWHLSQGQVEQAVDHLLLCDSVARKCCLNARGMIKKICCISLMGSNLKTASLLVNHPNMTADGMSIIQKHFAGFDEETVSMRNPIIVDQYLVIKDSLDSNEFDYFDKPKTRLFYKRNSTLRFAWNLTENLLARIEEREPQFVDICRFSDLRVLDFEDEFIDDDLDMHLTLYKKYNITGYTVICILSPAFGRVLRISEKFLEENRLLVEQIKVLSGGDTGDYKIFANEEESYIFFESRLDKYYSRRKAIYLPINPENVGKYNMN